MFSFRNVKVAAQGHYCVNEKRHHLVGLIKGRSNEMSYINVMYLWHIVWFVM